MASLICVCLIAYWGVRIVLGWLNPPSLWESAVIAEPAPMRAAAQAQSYNFSSNPFSLSTEMVDTSIENLGETAPETTLQLTLTGLITGPDGEVNLRTPDGREARYAAGDEIMGGVTLESINPSFIVLNVNGDIQRLTFDAEDNPLITSPAPKPASNSAATPRLVPSNTAAELSVFENLLNGVNIMPAFKDNKMQGIQISPKTDSAAFAQYGFQDGDIITQIGSAKLNTPSTNFIEVMRSLEGKRSVTVTVIRDGRARKIRLGQ